MFKQKVISCQLISFKDKVTGQDKTFYKIFLIDPVGAVGYVSSKKPYTAGSEINLQIKANNDGKLFVSVVE